MISTIFENIINSLDSIWANKLRASLSMLWIIIWVSSVIILTALGNWSSKSITDQIEELWTNILTLTPGRGFWRDSWGSQDVLNPTLVESIQNNIEWLDWVVPVITGNADLAYGSTSISSSLYWINRDFFTTKNIEVEFGTNFSEDQITQLEKVAIIWKESATELFAWDDPIGKKVKMWNSVFEVVWVIEENTTYSTALFIPITTASIRVVWQKYYSQVIIAVTDSNIVELKQEEIEAYLNNFLEVKDTNSLPYRMTNQSEILQNFSSITETLTLLLSWIAWISLLVWWIWVMNIMLVSVTERTREIWIRKAIWAGKSDILLQFLTEALSISVIGWAIWILISYWAVFLLNYFSITAVISVNSITLSFCFSLFIWLVFGILPAYKAAKLRPIDALRFE